MLGAAGVGKSRLIAEFLKGLTGEVRVVRGRCLPYGEGITFWPLVGVLRESAGIGEMDSPEQAEAKFAALLEAAGDSALIRQRLTAAVGDLGCGAWDAGDLLGRAQAVRRAGEPRAHGGGVRRHPLGRAHVPRSARIPGRLAPRRSGLSSSAWPDQTCSTSGANGSPAKANALLIRLGPLAESETERLIQNLLGSTPAEGAVANIADVAGGNPLFVEETLRMLIDEGLLQRRNGSWSVVADLSDLSIPPTIHSLLTARVDMLDEGERDVIERASVVGRVFWWGAVTELSPPRAAHQRGWLAPVARSEGADPSGALRSDGRRRVPLHPHPGPGRGLRRCPQGPSSRIARAIRSLAPGEESRPRR